MKRGRLRSALVFTTLAVLTSAAFAALGWLDSTGRPMAPWTGLGLSTLAFASAAEDHKSFLKERWYWILAVLGIVIAAVPVMLVFYYLEDDWLKAVIPLGIVEALAFNYAIARFASHMGSRR